MKMNKNIAKFLAVAAVVMMAGAASAKYVYCMIENANYEGNAIDFSYATVSIDGGYSYLDFYTPAGVVGNAIQSDSQEGYQNYSAGARTGTGAYAQFDDDTPEYTTFLFELFASNDNRVGWQQYSLSALIAAKAVGDTTSASEATVFKITNVIPEPTSGILLLLGMAGLALRRRKA